MDLAFLCRQPIFTASLEVFAYELLFRSGQAGNAAMVQDGDQATASVVLNLLTDIGLERVVDDRPAFINMTRNLLLNADLSCLPPERIVLEVLEDIEPDEEVLAAVRRLAEAGFTIALDDVVYRKELEPLIELADIIKVDLPQIPLDELPTHVAALQRHSVKLLVEKVETQEEFDLCKQLGFSYFQGYFFCKPQILSERRVGGNQVAAMRLLSELQDPAITPEKVEDLLRMDPTLSFQVLRFVNSSSNGLSNPIESIRHAAVVMGVQRIRSFASMMVLRAAGDAKPLELMNVALTRAKLCELVATRMGETRTERPFTVGLLSVLDAVLDRPMNEVIELLPLSEDINAALLEHTGSLGRILESVMEYEHSATRRDSDPPVVADRIHPDAYEYLAAVEWANGCLRSMA